MLIENDFITTSVLCSGVLEMELHAIHTKTINMPMKTYIKFILLHKWKQSNLWFYSIILESHNSQ